MKVKSNFLILSAIAVPGFAWLTFFALLPLSRPALSQPVAKAVTTTTQLNKTKMKGFKTNIQKDVLVNKDFRKVLYTAKHLQLVLMTLKPGEDIGLETHPTIDQFFRFESGHGKGIINGHEYEVSAGDVLIVPAGALHNIINVDKAVELKMYTIYAGPNHKTVWCELLKKKPMPMVSSSTAKQLNKSPRSTSPFAGISTAGGEAQSSHIIQLNPQRL